MVNTLLKWWKSKVIETLTMHDSYQRVLMLGAQNHDLSTRSVNLDLSIYFRSVSTFHLPNPIAQFSGGHGWQ